MIFNLKQDLFKMYPELAIQFENKTSDYLWALLLDFHPDSSYVYIPMKERREIIDKFFKVNWADAADDIALLTKIFIKNKKLQILIGWERKLEERQAFLDSLPYDSNNYELLDKMMSQTYKMWQQYMLATKDADSTDSAEGGGEESLNEQGKLF